MSAGSDNGHLKGHQGAQERADEDSDKYLMAEFAESNRYYLHVESTMHDVLKFYTALLLALLTASFTLVQMLTSRSASTPGPLAAGISIWTGLWLMWFAFELLGLLDLYYYLELRVRKIRLVEQIAAVREFFATRDASLSSRIRLIPSVKKCPPYLRRPCAEWYAVIYICFINAVAWLFFLYALNRDGRIASIQPRLIGASLGSFSNSLYTYLGIFVVSFLLQFSGATVYAFWHDLKREVEVGPSDYDLFVHGRVPVFFKPLNSLANALEGFARRRPQRVNPLVVGEHCLFCDLAKGSHRVVAESELLWAVLDNFPVSKGHTLIVPKRHVESFFDLTEAEASGAFRLIKRVREMLDQEFRPDGYNIGVNNGEAAGQTVRHLHIHMIPRHRGDVANPQGGIRNIIPNLVSYTPPKR